MENLQVEIRLYLRRRGIRITIPRKDNERRRGKFDKLRSPSAQPGYRVVSIA